MRSFSLSPKSRAGSRMPTGWSPTRSTARPSGPTSARHKVMSGSPGQNSRPGCSTRSKRSMARLAMAKVLLGVTGSVAAIYTRELFDDLRRGGHDVKVVATAASLYFFDSAALAPAVVVDADEWPGERYQRGDP